MHTAAPVTRPLRKRLPRIGRMSVSALLVAGCVAAAASSVHSAPRQATPTPSVPAAPQEILGKYCVTCHNQRLRTAGLALETFDATTPSAAPEVWERVI